MRAHVIATPVREQRGCSRACKGASLASARMQAIYIYVYVVVTAVVVCLDVLHYCCAG